jgi:hypothetical protein
MIYSGSDSGSDKKFRIRPDPDPQHWFDDQKLKKITAGNKKLFLPSWIRIRIPDENKDNVNLKRKEEVL